MRQFRRLPNAFGKKHERCTSSSLQCQQRPQAPGQSLHPLVPALPAETPRPKAILTSNPQATHAYNESDSNRGSNVRQEWEEASPCTGHSVRSLLEPRYLSEKTRYGKDGNARKTSTNVEAEAKGRPDAQKLGRKRGRTRFRNPNDAGVGGNEHRNATESEKWIKHRVKVSSYSPVVAYPRHT